jgi:hypothetical protein
MAHATSTQNARSRGGLVGAQGRRRSLQLAAEAEAERKALEAELIADLGRRATAYDRIAINNIAAMHVRARRLEAQGKNATEERRQITQMMRGLGLKPAPVEQQKAKQSLQDWWQTANAEGGGQP